MKTMKELSKPKVSVCMPNYNCSRYLPEAIESVLKQSYTDFEFIIIDDCSTDDSLDIIKRYAEKDKRIIVHKNERNVGQTKNLNLCLREARGDYIKFVFSDDTLVSDDAVKKMVEVLESNDQIALVASARYSINEFSTVLGVISGYKDGITCGGTEIIKDCLLTQTNKIGEPTSSLFRKKHVERGFNEKYNKNQDWEMWFHILEQGSFSYIDQPLCSFRTHPLQLTNLYMKNGLYFAEPYYILKDYAEKPYMHSSKWEKMYLYYLPAFEIWNRYKKGRTITLRKAIDKIHEHYGVTKYILFYPIYKIYRAYLSTQKRIKKIRFN